MTEAGVLVQRLVRAVADEQNVDWDAALRRSQGPGQRRVVLDLRRLANRVSGSTHTLRAGNLGASTAPTALPTWASIVMACAALHVVQGLLGYALAWQHTGVLQAGLAAVISPLFGGTAGWLLRAGRRDRRAVALAGFFLTVASAAAYRGAALAVAHGPALGALSAFNLALLPECFLPYFLWQFVRDFPRVVALSRLDDLAHRASLLSATCGALLAVNHVCAWLYAPSEPASAPWLGVWTRNHPGGAYWALTFLLAAPALVVALLRTREAARGERRRVALFLGGLVAGVAPVFVLVLLETLVPAVRAAMGRPGGQQMGALIVYVPLASVPLTTAHAVLAGGLLAVSVAPLQAFARRRRRVVAATDLHALSVELHDVRSATEAQACLTRHVTRVLPVDAVLMLARNGGDGDFLPLTAGLRPLAHDSALAALVSASHALLVVPSTSPEFRWLPEADRCWLVDTGVQALLPVGSPAEAPVGLLALTAQGRELHLGNGDHLFLAALALSTAPVWSRANIGGPTAPDRAAGACHVCHRVTAKPGLVCACGRPTTAATIPQRLNGKFLVSAVLGRGGMGIVYRATDLTLGRDVALKTLPRVSAQAALRLRAEARAMATLSHPHVAPIFGAESWRGVPVLVVEFLEGGTLAARLASGHATLDVGTVLEHGEALASALEALHRKGLVHRDVKPSNIGFTADGIPKLLDFGLARLVAEAHQAPLALTPGPSADTPILEGPTTSLAGTLLYLPPEALRGHASATAQDLWALALVLYEMLTGVHPWRQLEAEAGRRALAHGRVPDVREARPDCPEAVARWLTQALHPRHELRPASAAVLRAGLARLRKPDVTLRKVS